MPINGLNVGKDVSLDIVTAIGFATFRIRTNFKAKAITEKRKSVAADGKVRWAFIPTGWEGSFMFDRGDAGIDQFFAQQEAFYYAGLPINAATITETIQEADGSVSQFQYIGVALALEDAGTKSGDDLIKMEVSWSASRRNQLA